MNPFYTKPDSIQEQCSRY